MNAKVIELEESRAIRFDVTDTAIAKLKNELTGLTDYKAVTSGIAVVRDLRVSVEATRKALKEDSLAWGRKVDAEAKRITDALKSIEEPLKLIKQQIDDAKEAAKKAAEAARIAEVERRLKAFEDLEYAISPYKVERFSDAEFCDELEKASAKFREVLAARAEAKAKAEADRIKAIADEAARAEALRIEREQLAAERKKLDAEKAERDEANRKQAEAMTKEREQLKADRERLAKADFDRQAKVQAEADEKQRIEDAAKAEANRLKLEAENAKRVEALKPDIDKVRAFGVMMNAIEYPCLETIQGKQLLFDVNVWMKEIVKLCKEFQS
jgi:septal ring factor EnvC (AmiA/AmiB activator)